MQHGHSMISPTCHEHHLSTLLRIVKRASVFVLMIAATGCENPEEGPAKVVNPEPRPEAYTFVREGVEEGADETTVIAWGITGDGVLVVSGNGAMKNYTYQTVGDKVVTSTPWTTFDITSVVVEKGITVVGEYAFAGEEKLKTVTLGEDVLSTSTGVFAYCTALEQATLGSGLKEIGISTFYQCGALKSIELPAGVTTIDHFAFFGCKVGSPQPPGRKDFWGSHKPSAGRRPLQGRFGLGKAFM